MLDITRVAHLALRSSSTEELEHYFTEVLGFWECRRDDDGSVHLTCGGPGATVELIPSDKPGLDHVAFAIAPGISAEDARKQLAEDGVEASDWERSDPGAQASLRIHDPEGNPLQLMVPDGNFNKFRYGRGIRPLKLGHVATRVENAKRMQKFYESTLGFRFSDSIADMFVFMRCGADHHSVNFLEASNPGELHHVAFELKGADHIRDVGDILRDNDIQLEWGPGRHGAGHNLFTYHRDPDNNIIELYAELDQMKHESQGYFDPRPWHTDQPQVPRVWNPAEMNSADTWGSPLPPSFLD